MNQLFDDLIASTRRTYRGDDLGLTHGPQAYNATGERVQSPTMRQVVRGSGRRVLAIGATEINGTSPAEQALAADGMLIVMESDVTLAQQARQRFSSAGLGGRATVITGDPRRMLHK